MQKKVYYLIIFILGVIILGCLFYGCSFSFEGLEPKVPQGGMLETDLVCQMNRNEKSCMDSTQCMWTGSSCVPNTIDLESSGPQLRAGMYAS
jgi:hypothetical protein